MFMCPCTCAYVCIRVRVRVRVRVLNRAPARIYLQTTHIHLACLFFHTHTHTLARALALSHKVASWCLPDAVVVFDEALPLQATGKVFKLKLRKVHVSHHVQVYRTLVNTHAYKCVPTCTCRHAH